jgi:hypothetical protein
MLIRERAGNTSFASRILVKTTVLRTDNCCSGTLIVMCWPKLGVDMAPTKAKITRTGPRITGL